MGQAIRIEHLLWFALAFGATFLLTPLVRLGAVRLGFVDPPRAEKIHTLPLPMGGGVALFIAFWVTLYAAIPENESLPGFFVASALVLLLGLIDDWIDLRWYWKLAGQLLAALILIAYGERIEFVTHPLSGETVYIGLWGVPLTILWLVAMANMINLIDGLDGLASGVCTIAAIPLYVTAATLGRWEPAVMTVAVAGACAGFLPHNFNPARIILGDAGAMFLGFALGVISVEGALKGTTTLAFIVPVLALGLPIFDTVFAVARRFASGRPFYTRDTDHLHNRLLSLGLSHRQAVLVLYVLSAIMGGGAVLALGASRVGGLAVFAAVALGAGLFARRVGGLRGFQTPSRRVTDHR